MYLGIDGGGTKTAFVLLAADGQPLARASTGSAYHPQVGVAGVRDTLAQGINEILHLASISASQITSTFIGLPAYGEDPKVDPEVAGLGSVALHLDSYQCGNDMVCSWAGSLACTDGISVIAGTGSIAYGEFEGRHARSGGWGEVFGDEGSAYWIAREGLNLFSRMSDGRVAPGPLQQLVRQHFQLSTDLDLAGIINDPSSATRSEFAQIARLVADAAQAGDVKAQGVFTQAGLEIAQMIVATRHLLEIPRARILPVSYTGGLFHSGDWLLTALRTALLALDATCQLQPPKFDPAVGAALYAARRVGVYFSSHQLDQLAEVTRV